MTDQALVLTIFSKPSCTACTNTKRKANADSLPFQEFDITDGSPWALDAMKLAGALLIKEAPLVIVGPASSVPFAERQDITVWSGYRPDLLEHFSPRLRTATAEDEGQAAA